MKKITLTSSDGTLSFDATLSDNCTRIIDDLGNEAKGILVHGSRNVESEWGLRFYGENGHNVEFNFKCNENGRRTLEEADGFRIVDGREEMFSFNVSYRYSDKEITEIHHHSAERVEAVSENNIAELHK